MPMPLHERLHGAQPLFAEIGQTLAAILRQAGLEQSPLAATPGSHSELREDPFDHSQALYVEWRSQAGLYQGSILVNGDGQAFAEFDVLLPHPRQPRWVIEAVTAWGRPGALKGELRLLPALEP